MSEKFACPDCHVSYPAPEPRTFSFNSPMGACPLATAWASILTTRTRRKRRRRDRGRGLIAAQELTPDNAPCPECKGARLRKESLHFKLAEQNISELCRLSVTELAVFFTSLL